MKTKTLVKWDGTIEDAEQIIERFDGVTLSGETPHHILGTKHYNDRELTCMVFEDQWMIEEDGQLFCVSRYSNIKDI